MHSVFTTLIQRLVCVLLRLDLLSHWLLLLLKVTVWHQEGPVHTGDFSSSQIILNVSKRCELPSEVTSQYVVLDHVNSRRVCCRGESVESFPMLSRNASRNMERDWDNGSTASSITSVAEYNGET